ncbi:hypothetical protein TBLA_0D04210 [Henningerozyma blattae CBS 6284]|uniref:uS12 prolyl 3,4-dihydroxylase n=1 Tax=Henningerozyma blattae (strain ATCC 34711 / CBS 6284 / DSM 70876 / NBRC 10599 / NRRL Y-10934 / UCD 77-7) TaxID=1071380 RepID=I2H3G6_HENB6|nr:hypothetical protein TBLA_0D04210 [Tetrapisispora blattae CBS 6284]CCH60918.1 hypothetical protein TBLA_0D04210 [Tetrapisispora blattae CBS 6284]
MKRSSENSNDSSKIQVTEDGKAKSLFNSKLWDPEFRDQMKDTITNNKPYEWGTITDLVDDELLRAVRKEIETEISFSTKETDIYRLNQSGDLANLSNLDDENLKRLPNLYKLRSILYSNEFRKFMAYITQSGKLSESKRDLNIAIYNKNCHLLPHDDVVGSRRISYILYLPEPDRKWKDHYGGGLRLYDSKKENVPYNDPFAKLVPQFNQIAFFKIQPGLSFHDVEEVVVDKNRLSLQGWFHIPQEGEDGYIENEEKEWIQNYITKLTEEDASDELKQYEFPKDDRSLISSSLIKEFEKSFKDFEFTKLTDNDIKLLKDFISEEYLTNEKIAEIQEEFIANSTINLSSFLNDEKSELLKNLIKHEELQNECPNLTKDVKNPWKVASPIHKWKFMYIDGKPELKDDNQEDNEGSNFKLLRETIDQERLKLENELIKVVEFLKSKTFKKFILLLTKMIPITEQILIRRFRSGNDFTMANRIELNKYLENIEGYIASILEATLCLTPSTNWEDGTNGGYEVFMAEVDDNAVNIDIKDTTVYDNKHDSVLINNNASWNTFSLALIDDSLLEFVKYVSFNAKGSRWDIKMKWDVKE